MEYPILIADYNSSGIRAEAARAGITHMREIARDGIDDNCIVIFALPLEGAEIQVADTNADPIWREADEQGWQKMLDDCPGLREAR